MPIHERTHTLPAGRSHNTTPAHPTLADSKIREREMDTSKAGTPPTLISRE